MTVAVQPEQPASISARERIELILRHIDRLPTLPPVAARLLAVTSSDDSSAQDVVDIIGLDASLTAGILRLARRAELGVRNRRLTVAQAVTLLGFRTVRNAVLSNQFFSILTVPGEDRGTVSVCKSLWRHNLAAACAAEAMADKVAGPIAASEAFLCGLLHDIGKIALAVCLPKSYLRVLETVRRSHRCINDVERELFGMDHTAAGKRLLTRWGLSSAVIECVWLHHQGPDSLPPSASHPTLVKIVHVADNLVRRARIGLSGYQYIDDLDRVTAELGLDADIVEALIESLPLRMEPFVELVGLDDEGQIAAAVQAIGDAQQQIREQSTCLLEQNQAMELRCLLLDAIRRFVKAVSSQATVEDVCAAAAQAAREGLPIEGACSIAVGNNSDRWVLAGCGADFPEPLTTRWNGQEGGNVAMVMANDLVGVAGAPRPAGSDFESIWSRVTGKEPHGSLWWLPFPAGSIGGGLLMLARESGLGRCLEAGADWEAFARTLGLSIAMAWARENAERISEEVLDLNRRLKEAQSSLLQMKTMSMIAEMAGGAAHELNNPLAVISGRAQMELGQARDEKLRQALGTIVEQTQKASNIVLELMQFAKPESPTPIVQPLSDVLDAVYQHWKRVLGERANRLSTRMDDHQVVVYADSGQLVTALNEVVANALEAADHPTGRVQINSCSRSTDDKVRLVIEDNGCGMSTDVLAHALDPFFSSRPAGRRRGLGLSRAYRLMELNGGRLWLESAPNIGTVVTIELPAHAPAV